MQRTFGSDSLCPSAHWTSALTGITLLAAGANPTDQLPLLTSENLVLFRGNWMLISMRMTPR